MPEHEGGKDDDHGTVMKSHATATYAQDGERDRVGPTVDMVGAATPVRERSIRARAKMGHILQLELSIDAVVQTGVGLVLPAFHGILCNFGFCRRRKNPLGYYYKWTLLHTKRGQNFSKARCAREARCARLEQEVAQTAQTAPQRTASAS